MPNSLSLYHQKRDFQKSPEPAGQVMASGDELSFVIQKHAARRLHYDFRLELDGTLKSWAVPKGPSLDPGDKRMAVEVEDHPLSYAGFEGTIPPGHYGAGSVIVWDRGTWQPVGDPRRGLREGKLKFELQGEKLRGGFTLVRMRPRDDERQTAWLLIKERDDEARDAAEFDVVEALPDSVLAAAKSVRAASPKAKAGAAKPAPVKKAPPVKKAVGKDGKVEAKKVHAASALPLSLSPQLATLVSEAPSGDDWLYEIKFDGYRLLTRIDGDDVRCFTRAGHDWSHKLPALVTAVRELGLPSGWLDGEIIVPDKSGAPDFQALQNAFEAHHTSRIQYCLFDLPFCDGHDLRPLPLVQRRELLASWVGRAKDGPLRFSESIEGEVPALLKSVQQAGLEGLIGKRRDAPYRSQRSSDWIKLKVQARQEFVIGGFTDPQGARTGLGALLLGTHDEQGALRYAGNVGTGFSEKVLADLREQLDALVTERSPFADAPQRVGTVKKVKPHWVSPKLMAEVSFARWTNDGHVRHAVFHGLRNDKPPRRITKEVALAPPAKSVAASTDAPKRPTRAKARSATHEPTVSGSAKAALPKMRITHPERVIDAQSGVTKGELIAFYAQVAALMLPHLKQRPVSLMRAPSGIDGPLFFQKHAETRELAHVDVLDRALYPAHDPLLAIGSDAGLLSAVQMNTVEFHTWNATTRSMGKPDRMLFDLDPGEGVLWAQVQEAATLVRSFLDELGLVSMLKTSGGKGLHVVVPLKPQHDWDTVKAFSRAIVQHLADVIPQRFVAKSGPKNRVGRIFVDYLRNGLGATTVAAWSARARPGLGVSVPVSWDELPQLNRGAHWTVQSIASRLVIGNAPWADLEGQKQLLAGPMKALGFKPSKGVA